MCYIPNSPSPFRLGILQTNGQRSSVASVTVLDSGGQLQWAEREVWREGGEELDRKCVKASKQSRQAE